LKALDDLLEDATAGDPITGLKWTRKTGRKLSRQLERQGFQVGRTTVRRLVHERGYRQRANRKRLSRKQDPRRDRQMRYIARQQRKFIKAGDPVISVDTKKKELIGLFKNPGRTLRRQPLEVLATDFPSDAEGKAIPYGIYDLQRDAGYMVIGTSHETAEFAIAAIRRWWLEIGRVYYAGHTHLLIEADGGGANGSASWLWKAGLQQLADEFDLTITVAHYPPGTSKWNPIEHRMFGPISLNWAGQPLISYETMLKFIRTTRTETGFHCRARLDTTIYSTGRTITAEEKARINLHPLRVFPKWNYTIKPHKSAKKK
jgi:Rhodopirellula transposase DDE domain